MKKNRNSLEPTLELESGKEYTADDLYTFAQLLSDTDKIKNYSVTELLRGVYNSRVTREDREA